MSTHKTGCFYRAEITTEQGTAGRPCVHPAPRSPTAWSPAQGAESWIPILRVQSHLQLCSSWLLQRTSASQLALTTASMLAALSPPVKNIPFFFFPLISFIKVPGQDGCSGEEWGGKASDRASFEHGASGDWRGPFPFPGEDEQISLALTLQHLKIQPS